MGRDFLGLLKINLRCPLGGLSFGLRGKVVRGSKEGVGGVRFSAMLGRGCVVAVSSGRVGCEVFFLSIGRLKRGWG